MHTLGNERIRQKRKSEGISKGLSELGLHVWGIGFVFFDWGSSQPFRKDNNKERKEKRWPTCFYSVCLFAQAKCWFTCYRILAHIAIVALDSFFMPLVPCVHLCTLLGPCCVSGVPLGRWTLLNILPHLWQQ